MKWFTRIAGASYAAVLFYIFFLARRRPHATVFRHNMPKNIVPLKHTIEKIFGYRSMYPHEQHNLLVDIFGNIGLFIPAAFFLHFIFKINKPWQLLLICACASACVEFTQYFFSIGVADIDDIIFNTLGAAIGIGMLFAMKKWFSRLYLIFDQ